MAEPLTPHRTLARRRAVFAGFALAIAALLLTVCWQTLAPGGWTPWEVVILLCYAGTVPWTALCTANGLAGFALQLGCADPPATVLPVLRRATGETPRLLTAIAVCVRNERLTDVLPPLERLLHGLQAAGAAAHFIPWILSDTADPALAAAEQAAIAASPMAAILRYRRRTATTGFKAGNVMDFLDRHAAGCALLLCLDADSEMSAAAVLRLVACMQAEPGLGILQQLIAGRPAGAAFPRLFQFGMRAGMRSWALGQAWWQGPHGPYWGHNAVIRIAPFRAHCRLGPLPDGSTILSHDQVEATRLHAAGWAVRCLPDEAGSFESNPPALPEFLRRDQRWAAGNMQYWMLLRAPGQTWMSRWQLLQAILLFAAAPLWAGMLAAAALNVATGGGQSTPDGALAALLAGTWLALHAPKLLGYAEVMLRPALARRHGGRARFLTGAAAELLFTTLLDPVSTFNKAVFLLRLSLGARSGWTAQNRANRGVGWRDATRLLWPHTLFGVAAFALLFSGTPRAALWALPFAGGLLTAIPFCVLSSDPAFSDWLRRRRIAATPEEREQLPGCS